MEQKILLVDDEKDIVEFLEYNLRQGGYNVVTAYDGVEAIHKLNEKPDLIILDVLMPKMDGYETCRKIRSMKEFRITPILFLTAKSDEIDEIKALDLGADDYVQKPVSPKKLVARVKSNLRKSAQAHNDKINNEVTVGPLVINKDQYSVLLNGDALVLPKKEFEILFYLATNPGKVFPRRKALNRYLGQ
ncbi:MAG: response regulator transcription factor [Melioribacteraceae bacterium]|nr:response regulator transcription factor [Melioribacteraceae bacterium]